MGDDAENLLKSALELLRRGWSVVQAAERSRQPLVRWQHDQKTQPSETDLRAWHSRWPRANLAVVTGYVSGIVVLDVDPGHGGEESLARLVHEHRCLPPTVEAITGDGGCHLYFQHPGLEVRNPVGLAPGLDIRGDGGVIIVPPSIHPSGNLYRWRKGHAPDEISLAPLPHWLLAPRLTDEPRGHPVQYWRELLHEGVHQGRCNQTIVADLSHGRGARVSRRAPHSKRMPLSVYRIPFEGSPQDLPSKEAVGLRPKI